MGKVFKALSKARDEADQIEAPVSGGDDVEIDLLPPDDFDFMSYSLGAASIAEKEHARREAAEATFVREARALPVHEVTVDPRRVDPHLIAFYNPDPRAIKQYDKLALSLVSKAAEQRFKRVLIASAEHGDGRTTVTLNLACSLARAKRRVLVIDCDLMKPSALRALGIDCEIGLAEAFSMDLPPGQATLKILPYGFNLLPTRRPVSNPAEMFTSPGFWKLLQSFDSNHDFVLFDSSPLLVTGESNLLARFVDTTLLVVRAGETSSAQMAKAIAPFTQEDLFGVVLNRANQ